MPFVFKSAQAVLLAIAVSFSSGTIDQGARSSKLSHNLMCTCGCAQLLGECSHAGCTSRVEEFTELNADITSGATDKEILASFVTKYGATVLAAPSTHGFDLVAWVVPFAVFAAAFLGTILLVRRWSTRSTEPPAPVSNPVLDALREKVRRETDPPDS